MRKSHKLATFIITLCILLPALAITALYPRTGAVMDRLRNQYKAEYDSNLGEDLLEDFVIENRMVNYAMEATYYMFGLLLQECENRAVDFSVLNEYGWDSDFHSIMDRCRYLAVYRDILGVDELSRPGEPVDEAASEPAVSESMVEETESAADQLPPATEGASADEIRNVYFEGSDRNLQSFLDGTYTDEELTAAAEQGIKAFLVLEYDAYGMLTRADMIYTSDNVYFYSNFGGGVYSVAKKSIKQYEDNVQGYRYANDAKGDYYRVTPKNFKAIFAIDEESDFTFQETYTPYGYYNSERLYWETGAVFIVIALACVVAAFALLLPFIKGLHTGWERLFSIHIETVCCVAGLGVLLAYFMMLCMSATNTYDIGREMELNGPFEFMGYQLSVGTIYGSLLVANFLGWALCFLMEYVVVAAFRQFLSRPLWYLAHRFLVIDIIRWLCRPFRKLYLYITDIDISHKLKNSILKIVIANAVVVGILCTMWFAGWIGVLIYSIGLYVIMKKYGSKLQEQFHAVIDATKQMADGNLKVHLDEDLGMFQPMGDALTKIQSGFSKAVAEEAKSQQMKTELITNVSHDLKTPLTAIITYVNLLKNPTLSEEERQSYVETLDQKSQRLKSLIEDLFEVSKAQSKSMQMNFMDVDVVSLMKQVRLEMEDQIMGSNLLFRWNLPEDKVILRLDGQKTYRVFVNLINNILKYSMPGSRVFVDVTADDDSVQIVFKNISKTELDFDVDRLTDRFVRGDQSRNTEGSGLGLAIVKSFVELQNGTFKIDVDGDLFKAIINWKR